MYSHALTVVTRDGLEVEWFAGEKDAAAYVQHVYGLSIYDLIGHEHIAIKSLDRGPKAGDLVALADGREGILCGDGSVCLNARTFREGDKVSCSGGPCVTVNLDDLKPSGLARVAFWRWADGYPAAHNDGEYFMHVPQWQSSVS